MRLLQLFREPDEKPSFYLEWAARAQTFHGSVIGYIEGLIVLAATQFAVQEHPSILTWGIYGCVYAAVLLLTAVYFRIGMGLLLTRIPVSGQVRQAMLIGAFILGLIFNIWLVGALDDIVSDLAASGMAD